MRYLLDTNTCIGVLSNRAPKLVQRWRHTPPSQVRLCSVVKAELIFGAEKSQRRDLVLQKLQIATRPGLSPRCSGTFATTCSFRTAL